MAYIKQVQQLLFCQRHESVNLLLFSPEVVYAECIDSDSFYPQVQAPLQGVKQL